MVANAVAGTVTAAALDVDSVLADVVRRTRPTKRAIALGLLVVVLAVTCCASLAFGARDIPVGTVLGSLVGDHPRDSFESLVIHTERIPRTVLGVIVGASLGVSGLLMQGVTRNPLADPGILGIQSGAGLFIVIGILAFDISGSGSYFWFGLIGAALTAAAVWTASRAVTSTSPEVSLVIAGASAAALIASAITLVTIRDAAVYVRYRSWSVGILAGDSDTIATIWPFVVVGLVAALFTGGRLNALNLGDEMAAGLGTNVVRSRLLCTVVAVELCAAATAAIGPVAFVGLVAPHLARLATGSDHRWLVPYSALGGAVTLVAADVLGRLAPGRGEIEVGIMTALVGAPFYIVLSRRRKLAEL